MPALASDVLRRWRRSPATFMRECLGAEPDAWQEEVLEAFPKNPRLAMCACKGPGKTMLLAVLAWNFLLTRPHPKIAACSINEDNLADGLWTEMSKWQKRSPLLSAAFTWTKTRIYANDSPETWWMSARTWAKTADKNQQAHTLAGLHADYLLFILDESGGIPDAVMAAAEAGLANACEEEGREAHIVQAGNPTHLEGPLYRAATSERHLWWVKHITGDPDAADRSPRVSVKWARHQIEKYGIDNPWVLVNVFGKFPPSSLNSLLGPDEVREAMERTVSEDEVARAARVLGVDVAREGDDRSVIAERRGRLVFPPDIFRNIDSIQGAGQVARKWKDRDIDGVFVDASGGHGWGWIDQLRVLGRDPVPVKFSDDAIQSDRYVNRRAEMWFEMATWVKEGGALPNVPELVAELTTPTYFYKGDRIQIEPKEMIKERLLRSPDIADAIALTFAAPVTRPTPLQRQAELLNIRTGMGSHGGSDWDPLSMARLRLLIAA